MVFYVGIIRGREEAHVRVVPETEGRPTDLDKVRKIVASNRDEAARKYIEQITGGTAAIRRRN